MTSCQRDRWQRPLAEPTSRRRQAGRRVLQPHRPVGGPGGGVEPGGAEHGMVEPAGDVRVDAVGLDPVGYRGVGGGPLYPRVVAEPGAGRHDHQ